MAAILRVRPRPPRRDQLFFGLFVGTAGATSTSPLTFSGALGRHPTNTSFNTSGCFIDLYTRTERLFKCDTPISEVLLPELLSQTCVFATHAFPTACVSSRKFRLLQDITPPTWRRCTGATMSLQEGSGPSVKLQCCQTASRVADHHCLFHTQLLQKPSRQPCTPLSTPDTLSQHRPTFALASFIARCQSVAQEGSMVYLW